MNFERFQTAAYKWCFLWCDRAGGGIVSFAIKGDTMNKLQCPTRPTCTEIITQSMSLTVSPNGSDRPPATQSRSLNSFDDRGPRAAQFSGATREKCLVCDDPIGEQEKPKKTSSVPPTIEEIRQHAHEIFMARGGTPGNELDDWLRAEQELQQERAGTDKDTT